MMTIDEEIEQVVKFLSNKVGYSISLNGDISIVPVYGSIEHWEVMWREEEENLILDFQKVFFTLEEAAQFFVEKRRYLCLGVDFVEMYNAPDGDH